MSTSDKHSQPLWSRWQPEDLLSDKPASLASVREPEVQVSSEQTQAELRQLRAKMEQKGFAEGQAKGFEEGQRAGYQQGFQQGMQEGSEQALRQTLQEQQQKCAEFDQLLQNFCSELNSLQRVIPARLVQLALTAAREVVGHNLADDRNTVLEKIQQLMQQEALFKGAMRLWVSEQDVAAVEERFGATLSKQGWELHSDPQILPGGCRITSEEGEVDATLAARWEALCSLSRKAGQL